MKYYEKGYSKIHPLYSDRPWTFAVQVHKNGKRHFDIRLYRPEEKIAYSWATRSLPFPNVKPMKVYRTRDHDLESMKFQGMRRTKKGVERIRILELGPAEVETIDTQGITFSYKDKQYRLRPHKGKQYYFEYVGG